MKDISRKYSVLLAVVSGLLTAFAFPARFGSLMLPDLGFLAWFSLVPLFVAIYHASLRRTFTLTFITAFIYHGIALYWLYKALTEYGKLSPLVTVLVLALMMTILAVYVSLAPAWTRWFRKRWGGSSIYLLPTAWVTVMIIRNYFPAGGFPWANISHTQAGYPIIIQNADLFGVYGLAFFMIMVNQLLAELVIGWGEAKKLHLGIKALAAVVIFSVVLAYGWYRMETIQTRSPSDRTIRVALVQGNIPQEEKWNDKMLAENFEVYSRYMNWISSGDITLTIWPESAYPYVVPLKANKLNAEKFGLNPEKKNSSWLLFGALLVDKVGNEEKMYNSSILVDNAGDIKGFYHKGHLVPFGEYVPFRKLLFFAKKLVAPVGDFVAGKGAFPLTMKDFKIGPLICYEDVFPEISREMVVNGANILINMTNDAWYGWTSAAYQHLSTSVFRAVENRRYVLRATNTGVTAVIDPRGKVELESRLFTRGVMATGVSLFNGVTVYDRIGDLFAYLCALVVLAGTAFVAGKNVVRKFKRKS